MLISVRSDPFYGTFFPLSDRRTRVRDYCDLTEISGIPGGSQTFGCRGDLSHFLAWRAGTNSRYSMRKSPPIKQGSKSSLLTWRLHARFITSTSCSSAGPGRSQQLEIPPSLNSKQAACFSSSACFSSPTNISTGTGISTPARVLLSA
jgi:hypothetical protein